MTKAQGSRLRDGVLSRSQWLQRDAHAHAETAAVQARAQLDDGIVQLGDALDDRHAEPASRLQCALGTVEGVENAFSLLLRESRPRVAHLDVAGAILTANHELHPPAFGRVADGVVE